MSDDELEKLAAAMKNMKPSEEAKARGMNAAMAAFDAEFTAQTESAAGTASEKNSAATQGSSVDARPTGQTTSTGRGQTRGSGIMSKINNFLSPKPQHRWMMGSCAAALLATLVFLPMAMEDPFGPKMDDKFSEIATSVDAESDVKADLGEEFNDGRTEIAEEPAEPLDEIIVTGSRHSNAQEAASAPVTLQAEKKAVPAPPTPEESIDDVRQEVASKIETDGQAKLKDSASSDGTIAFDIAGDSQVRTREAESQFEPVQLPSGGYRSNPITADDANNQVFGWDGSVSTVNPPSLSSPPPPKIDRNHEQLSITVYQSGDPAEVSSTKPETRTVTRRVMISPARRVQKEVPAVTKMETRRVLKEDGTYETVTEPVVSEPQLVWVTIPPVYEDVTEVIVVEPESRDRFESFNVNPVTLVTEKPVSTFSVDVDTASYTFLRASINRGQLPPPSSIRLEEMINYFPYDYQAPNSADEPFKANVTVTPTPWNADTKLMHIGIKGYVPPANEKPRSNLVFLIDTSGSMRDANKLPLLVNSFKLLLSTLDADDTVSIVTYAGSAGTVLEPTAASEKSEINAALNRLQAGGSTAGAAGLELAYEKAMESFNEKAINRVILATDGDFNVGFSSPEEMKRFVETKRKSGIFLSVLGFGMGNYNDALMQSLAQNGNGAAAYIDSLAEANKVLADEAGSALITIAKDVKIQVEFNPATVSEYRLIGYETRALKREDFNNDAVDAGEINSGHTVTAIYELTPAGSPAKMIDDLRYASEQAEPVSDSDEFAFVKIRHKLPSSDISTLQTFPVGPDQERRLKRASDDMRFATAVAAVGQKLRGDPKLADYSYDDAIKLAIKARGEDEDGYRAEFVQLVRLIDSLQE